MKVWERIESLRKRMREEDIDVYYIPTNDFHGSEYVSGYFQTREYISGFTGSAGVVIDVRRCRVMDRWTIFYSSRKTVAGQRHHIIPHGT